MVQYLGKLIINTKLNKVLGQNYVENEEELGFVKGCINGFLLVVPIWGIVGLVIYKYVVPLLAG